MIIVPPHQLLSILASSYLPENPLIIEAGAFWGHDSLKMAEQWPKGTVHAFEPVPEIFDELVKRTDHIPNIICHQQALSDTDNSILLHLAYKKNRPSQASSVHEPHQRLQLSPITFPKQITVTATTLTSFMHTNNLSVIDLLWLDLQGHEYNVLSHNTTLLRSIKFLHVEVYFVQAYRDHLLYHDMAQWLDSQNFTIIAKDFANEKDNFFGNILCMQKNFTL
ncbi:MAG TPA: FkbM family methyltransferase [Patescibacteria group bacterium]|jgi:FkbM family methyltransferase|nr:FkbM family methyltransferase [Patescibacteria group bacterium]